MDNNPYLIDILFNKSYKNIIIYYNFIINWFQNIVFKLAIFYIIILVIHIMKILNN